MDATKYEPHHRCSESIITSDIRVLCSGLASVSPCLRVRYNVVHVLRADQEQGFYTEPRRHGALDRCNKI